MNKAILRDLLTYRQNKKKYSLEERTLILEGLRKDFEKEMDMVDAPVEFAAINFN